MRSVKAIFIKQLIDFYKNKMVLSQFAVMPIVAFAFTHLVAIPEEEIPDTMFVTMFAGIFAGVTLITAMAGIIVEDRASKSIRFLVMSGVRPHEYLLGVGGVVLAAALVVSASFALMGGLGGRMFAVFLFVMLLGSVASMLLGATIGMISKNSQTAMALGMPIAMLLGFGPMVTMFNETAERIFSIFYTQQLNVVVNDFAVGLMRPLLIVLANIVVLLVVFTAAYRRYGLRA